jgi:hypothetical protein
LVAVVAVALALSATGVARRAAAFCGFYVSGSNERLFNHATRVALMRAGTRTVLSMSNDYQGPPQDFAMVVPVPVVLQQQNVRTLPMNVFDHVEALTAPRLVEYWEQDPCWNPDTDNEQMERGTGTRHAGPEGKMGHRAVPAVRIEAQFAVGEYEVVVLSATESDALETWLHDNHYNIPAGASEYLAPYVREQWKFFVARVDITRVARRPDGSARLSPLRFNYESQDFRLPVRLGLLNAPAQQDLIVYVLNATQRFEVANYPNAFIPTNIDVTNATRARFPEFYAALFDATLASAGGRAVVTEYAWATNSCDPCPTPPLSGSELATLGGDVLGMGEQSGWGRPEMVVTRLHTRYDRATLTEDLVFREAGAVRGGREDEPWDATAWRPLDQHAAPASFNNFQARYAIRHPWTGPMNCANPIHGRWGGPPDGSFPAEPTPARDLASAPRGRIELASFVYEPVPSLRVRPRNAMHWGPVEARPQPMPRAMIVVLALVFAGIAVRLARSI